MYLVVFDQHAKRLSGWHYQRLREIGGEWIQRSVVLCGEREVNTFVKVLQSFGVGDVRVFRSEEIRKVFRGSATRDYDKS